MQGFLFDSPDRAFYFITTGEEVQKGQEKEYSEHKRHHSRRWSECIQPSPIH